MAARILPAGSDPIRPGATRAIALSIDGERVEGLDGQTIAGVVLASGRLAWRRTSSAGKPRGLFCGIGVCFDCIVTVNGERDVRACQRRAADGDIVEGQHDALPEVQGSQHDSLPDAVPEAQHEAQPNALPEVRA